MNFRLPHSFNIFSFFFVVVCCGRVAWVREKKKVFFNVIYRSNFQERKERKEWKEQHTKKNRNKWMSGKYSRLETCVSREVYHLLYDLFILTQISIKDFFLLLGDWYNGMNGYEYEKIDVWIFIDCRMEFFL